MGQTPAIQEFSHGIFAVDTGYVRPGFDASHLIVRDGRGAFVDTGTTHSVPALMAALAHAGLTPDAVDYVLVTHVHLDHAGGAGELMHHLPDARLVVHPRGARHLVDPSRLIAGTMAVYGRQAFQQLYGDIPPVREDRIMEPADGETIRLGASVLELIHTPGHALHHYCIVDADSSSVFAGDTFGISYRIFDTAQGPFIFPATTPVHFDPDAAHVSIDRIMHYAPDAVFLTHYSRVASPARLAQDLHRRLDDITGIALRCDQSDHEQRQIRMQEQIHAWLTAELAAHGSVLDEATRDQWLKMDVELNAKGLAVWLDRVASATRTG